MSLEQKLKAIERLYYTDRNGVVWRLPASAREQAEQLVQDHPRWSLQDVLLRVPVEEPVSRPQF